MVRRRHSPPKQKNHGIAHGANRAPNQKFNHWNIITRTALEDPQRTPHGHYPESQAGAG